MRLYELKFGEFTVPHQLFLAANGYQVLLLAGKHCPHLVIADLNMPVMNGLQLIQEIRKTADMKDSKIIVATGLKAVDIMKMGTLPEDIMILPMPIPFHSLPAPVRFLTALRLQKLTFPIQNDYTSMMLARNKIDHPYRPEFERWRNRFLKWTTRTIVWVHLYHSD